MILRRIGISLPVAALALVTATASAQQSPETATSLGELYRRILEMRAEERAEFEKHKTEYDAAGPRQQQMLTDATRNRDEKEALSERLSSTHSANEVRINALNAELRDKAAALGLAEVFGLARQIASDTSTVLQQSMITTEFVPAAGEEWRDELDRKSTRLNSSH